MKIDIDALTEDELIELNFKIVERLKFLESMRAHNEMMEFKLGEKVRFEHPGRGVLFGTLVKFNKKTVTIITEPGERWNVSPHLLGKIKEVKEKPKRSGKVIEIHGKK